MSRASDDIAAAVRRLGRSQLETLLERHGFACYESESTETLEEAVRVNVADGTIPFDDLGEP